MHGVSNDPRGTGVIGPNSVLQLIEALRRQDDSDIKILGVFDDRNDTRALETCADTPKLGKVDDILEFARRTRRLYGDRTGVVDGDLRLTYEEFFARCDRWAAALQDLGVQPGDRVATIAPNTHSQLEAFYAVPEIGAVLVPINYRLSADDFAYILDHSGPVPVQAAGPAGELQRRERYFHACPLHPRYG